MKKYTKKDIILEIFNDCKKRNDFVFDNNLVKEVLVLNHSETNPYDMTKFDDLSKFPEEILNQGYFVIHLGNGRHQFVKNIDKFIFHKFEDIESNDIVNWQYRSSILNDYSTSENSILSLCYNQKIIHDFIYNDPHAVNPKIYNAERKRGVSFQYKIDKIDACCDKLQIEIDLTTELNGSVTVYEGKNTIKKDWIENFNVYQLYNPFRYYYDLMNTEKLNIKEINCCYLVRKKDQNGSKIRLYLYTFSDYKNIASIKLIKKAEYVLQKK